MPNSVPNNKVLDLFRLKVIANKLIDVGEKLKCAFEREVNTVKPVLETTSFKQFTALRVHCSNATSLPKSMGCNLNLKTTSCKRPLLLLPLVVFAYRLYCTCIV